MREYLNPPEGLLDAIMLRIEHRHRRRLYVRVALVGSLMLAAAAALVPAWNFLASEAARSGFAAFVSLVFSDFSVVLTYWNDFALSLLDSLPVYGFVAVLGSLLVFGISIRSFILTVSRFSAQSMRLSGVHAS
jgi:hypothetical protein